MRFAVGDRVQVTSSSDSLDHRVGWNGIILRALPCALWQLPEYYVVKLYADDRESHFYGHELDPCPDYEHYEFEFSGKGPFTR